MNSKIEKSRAGYFLSIGKNWKIYFSKRTFIIEFEITLILLAMILIFFAHFINIIEAREGVRFSDPLLKLIKPIDLSGIIFIIIYISIAVCLFSLLKNPPRFLFALQVYFILLAIRIVTLYLLPLDPPFNMIPLIDPIVKNLGTGQLLTKDLFFSGHTATLFLIFLVVRDRKLKIIFFCCFIIIALALLVQHVHYSIDIVSAPFFTYVSYRIVIYIKETYFNLR